MKRILTTTLAVTLSSVLSFSLLPVQVSAQGAGEGSGEEQPQNPDSSPPERTNLFTTGSRDELALAERLSFDYLARVIGDYGIRNVSDLKTERVEVDELSMAHTRVQQTLEGVPVFGGEAIVHLNSDGSTFAFTDTLVKDVRTDVRPVLGAADAIDRAIAEYGCRKCLTAKPEADIWIVRHKDRDRLAYRVQLQREDGSAETAAPVYFVDAHTGEKLWSYSNLHTATGTGVSLYSGTVPIDTSWQQIPGPDINTYLPAYFMEDLTRKIGTFNGDTSTHFVNFLNYWDGPDEQAGVDAHYAAGKFYDYLKKAHNRNGIDGQGGPLNATTGLLNIVVHYGANYKNAFWSNNGKYAVFGDGDGSWSPLVSLDIVGHELTHGLIQHTAGLTYAKEPGALNESWSDVFGAMLERDVNGEGSDVWAIGEQCCPPGGNSALRYLSDPKLTSQPDHYTKLADGIVNWEPGAEDDIEACVPGEENDYCGVHKNSGIANKAFHLVAQGGYHNALASDQGQWVAYNGLYQMGGIGASKAAKIWYKALTSYMTSGTKFAGARAATLNAAAALHGWGSKEWSAVAKAWGLVGVGGPEWTTNGGFEAGPTRLGGTPTASPWVFSDQAFYYANGAYPQSGKGYVVLGTTNNANGAVYQDVEISHIFATPTPSANLTFYLNVTSSETTTQQYDKLYVEVIATDLLTYPSTQTTTTLATYSNLDKAAAGVYSKKGVTYSCPQCLPNYSFDLSAYKDKAVRLQFRAETNSSNPTTFRIDGVSLQ